jgi:hypothetical protein
MSGDMEISKGMSHTRLLRHIGNVGVDSGNVMVIDPCHEDKELGVASPTAEGDGVYPVFQVLDNGALVGVFVDFISEPPDRDDRGTVSLGNVVPGAQE